MAGTHPQSVRQEVALSMRYIPFGKAKDILLQIAKGYDGEDRYYVEAFGIGCTDKEEKMYAELKKYLRSQKYDPSILRIGLETPSASSVSEIKSWALMLNWTLK